MNHRETPKMLEASYYTNNGFYQDDLKNGYVCNLGLIHK